MPATKDRYAKRGAHVFTVDLPQAEYDALAALAAMDSRKLRGYVRALLMRHIAEARRNAAADRNDREERKENE